MCQYVLVWHGYDLATLQIPWTIDRAKIDVSTMCLSDLSKCCSVDKRREITLRHNTQRHFGQSESEFCVYRWLPAHTLFDVSCFPAFCQSFGRHVKPVVDTLITCFPGPWIITSMRMQISSHVITMCMHTCCLFKKHFSEYFLLIFCIFENYLIFLYMTLESMSVLLSTYLIHLASNKWKKYLALFFYCNSGVFYMLGSWRCYLMSYIQSGWAWIS